MFDKIVIVDNSITQDAPVLPSPDRPRAFFQIVTPYGYGKDSDIKLLNANTQGQIESTWGTPNTLDTSLSLYYVYEFLRGGGDAYVRRITSATSSFAHAVIIAKFREGTGANAGKAEVQFELVSLADATDLNAMFFDAEALKTTTPDADGFIDFPIALANLNWSGKNGDLYTWRLMPNRVLDRQINAKGYTVQINNPLNPTPLNVEFTMDDATIVDAVSLYANDIFDTQSPNMDFRVLSGYKEFVAAITDFIPADQVDKPNIFFGTSKDNTPYPNYTILPDSADFTNLGGLPLSGGGDGSFDASNPTRQANIYSRIVESFQEDTTKQLVNEYKYYIDYVFDQNGPQALKDALVAFTGTRQTTSAIIDTGTTNTTVTSIVNMRRNGGLTYNSEKVVIVSGCGTYIDPFTSRKITMPLSFFESFQVASHVSIAEGGARPFAGNNYTYDNMVSGTYLPRIYDENGDEVELLNENQLNFAMEDVNGYTAMYQNTAIKASSVLGERNNVKILHGMIRTCLLEAKVERWNWAEDSDIEQYQNRITQRLQGENEGRYGELTVTAARAGDYGQDRYRVNVELYIRFKYINKGSTFTFTVS